jgi:hypothetical protein
MDLMEYMELLIEEVVPKVLLLPGIVKIDVTKLTQMSITPDLKQVENENKHSYLQVQVYYKDEEAYTYISSNVLDNDLMQILTDGNDFIKVHSGFQYSYQKYS